MPQTKGSAPGGASKTRAIRDGRDFTNRHADGDLHACWREFFQAALAGTTSAQRRTPNPAMVVRIAVTIADLATAECDIRRPDRRLGTVKAD